MSKAGRPPITKYVKPERMVKAYEVHGSLTKAAKSLCVNTKTLRRILVLEGVEIHKPVLEHVKIHRSPTQESKFVRWLRANPNIKLPTNMKKISKISGLSYDTVKGYIWRRRKALVEILGSLPSIKTLPDTSFFIDTLGQKIYPSQIVDYSFKVTKLSMEATIIVVLKNDIITEIKIENIYQFKKKLNKEART